MPTPPPGYTLNDEEDEAPPPGFTLDQTPAPSASPPDNPPLRNDSIVRPIDGDTLRLQSGRNLRLWGVDAPELNQQGWNRQGQPVPIGQQSQTAVGALIAGQQPQIGPQAMQSWGRPVAPVDVNGNDLGQMMTRQGNALAAPDFLAADAARRARYMEAERQARLNRLGMHGVMAQTPKEHRDNPGYVPERETVAQFWDTPTPFAGLRPEIEKGYLDINRTGTVDDILAYASKNGFTVDPTEVAQFVKVRDKGVKIDWRVNYDDPPKVLTDAGDGRTGAAVRGIGSGMLAGGLDEAGAVMDMLGMTEGRENVWNSDRRLADIWYNNQQQNASILGYDEMAHPGYRLGGQIAGGLAIPYGAGARTVPQLFKVGAAYGGVEGFLGTDGSVGERAKGAAIGAPVGGLVGAGAGKGLELAAPYARKIGNTLLGRTSEAQIVDSSVAADVAPGERDFIDVGTGKVQGLLDPLTLESVRAHAARMNASDVLPIPSNVVDGVEEAAGIDAGRFVTARVPHESGLLSRFSVQGMNGPVPKAGPVDMVGWLRLNGGLIDQGGELAHMGLTNAARKMDLAGQEQRFGPLVNENGMTLDDAALRAWEAGYFPEMTERPSVNDFLDALRGTHDGYDRRFLPEDQAEVEAFFKTRSERYDLEAQRQSGVSIVDDISVPADDQPFPPIEAYEEWPAGGPDFAGNINLGKLESPQDIARALSQVERRVGFDAATRGRVAQAETERLASELNLSPEVLLSRRKGQAFNAEEALAARQILAKSGNELVNAAKRVRRLDEPGDDDLADFQQKLTRHIAIQEQVSGMTAEAGRALQQFRMAADSRAVRKDVLSAMVRGGGGRDVLKDAAGTLIEAVEAGPGVFNAVAKRATQSKWRNRYTELYVNALLSNPATHAVNTVSNTLTAIAQVPEHGVASLIGKARSLVPGADIDRVTGSEVGARAFGLVQGAKEGARLFGRALRTGEPSDFVSKVEGQEYKAIPGLLGEVVRTPTRLLTAEDELFKGIARRMELNGLAVRQAHKEGLREEAASQRVAELIADPSDELLERAAEYGRYVTFQTKLEGLPRDISMAAQKSAILKTYLPFIRTPTNLLKFAVERSPAAPLLKSWRDDMRAGGSRRDLAVAKAVVGTGFGAMFYQMALDGQITGSAPSDSSKARALYADGWQPHSIRIGDTYYSYRRMDPFAMTLGVAADLAMMEGGMNERQREEGIGLLVASVMGNLASKTWLTGVSDLTSALADPERNADRMVQRLAGSLAVPAGVAGLARSVDPTMREVDSIREAVQARVPFASKGLLPRRDIWGEPIVNEGLLGPDVISPFRTSTQRNDPVNKALLETGYTPGRVSPKVGGRELTPQEHDRYQERAGLLSYQAIDKLVSSDKWKKLGPDDRKDALQDAVRDARKQARGLLFEGKSKGLLDGAPRDVQPPPGFTIDGASGGRNVYADLNAAIPGIRFTSGFRTPEYQSDMRKRGYRPATNSSHLDGSALDMLPPPGKSMDWLKQQVRQYDPNARLLVHDGHLHATFPGYYGAPPLGGARNAGLRNPLEGMPPPPPGFVMDNAP